MAFCKRCGDIVFGARCKCGGAPVSGVVKWDNGKAQLNTLNRATRGSLGSLPERVKTSTPKHPPERSESEKKKSSAVRETTNPERRFPRPLRTIQLSTPGRLPTPAASSAPPPPPAIRPAPAFVLDNLDSAVSQDILPSLHADGTLAKAYGSVLQPTLAIFACRSCSQAFPPDATIYPDPEDDSQYLCRSCFASNGGLKGHCATCSKAVLSLRSEGGFVEHGGRFWHRGCFRCESCYKDISNAPAVDLAGRPCCAQCFDKPHTRSRSPRTRKRESESRKAATEARNNIGGVRVRSRESSPVLEELEERLRIRSREGSPLRESVSPSPIKQSTSPRRSIPPSSPPSLRSSRSFDGLKSVLAEVQKRQPPSNCQPDSGTSIPDGYPDQSPRTSSPHSYSPPTIDHYAAVPASSRRTGSPHSAGRSPSLDKSHTANVPAPSFSPYLVPANSQPNDNSIPDSREVVPSPDSSKLPQSHCAACSESLYKVKGGGSFVMVPDATGESKSYHVSCFRCNICDQPFPQSHEGKATFVRYAGGAAHIECAPPERILRSPSVTPSKPRPVSSPAIASLTLTTTLPRFGSSTTCPGCHKSVSRMEKGVVPGPQGSRWHSSCLVCGGKNAARMAKRDPDEPGCGKKLDSAAKVDGLGGVWCSECLLLLQDSPQPSPVRSIFAQAPARVTPQFTGSGPITRHPTGSSGPDQLTRQLTGGGLSPTRQLMSGSPTKQLGNRPLSVHIGASALSSAWIRPRPKSVAGLPILEENVSRKEGRGMFLVRQMTGGK